VEGRGDKDYYWEEFKPVLKFNLDYRYEIPDVSPLIDTYNNLMEEMKGMKEDKSEITEKINNIWITLKDIAQKTTSYLMVLINRVIKEEKTDRYILSSYVVYCCFNDVGNKYLDYLIERQPDILGVKRVIDRLNEFFVENKGIEVNTLFFNKFRIVDKDLLGYMYFNPSSYKNDEKLINNYLRKKLEQIYLLTVQEGELKGQKRIFKEVIDPDFVLLNKVYEEAPEGSMEEHVIILDRLLMERYPGRSEQFRKHKIASMYKNKGIDRIDLVSNEYESDIKEKFNIEVRGLSNEELENKFYDFVLFNNLSNRLYVNGYGIKNDVDVFDIYDIGLESIKDLVKRLERFNPEWMELRIMERIDLEHRKIKEIVKVKGYLEDIDWDNFKRSVSSIFGFLGESINNDIQVLSVLLAKRLDVTKLNNLLTFENTLEELREEIPILLKRENIRDTGKKEIEMRFRTNLLREHYSTVRIRNIKGIINWLLLTINGIRNMEILDVNKLYGYSYAYEDRKLLIELVEPMRKYIDSVIMKCVERREVLYENVDLVEISEIIELVFSYNDGFNGEGYRKWLSVYNSSIGEFVMKMLMMHSLRLMIDSIYEDEEEIIRLVKELVINILEMLYKLDRYHNLTDDEIKGRIDTHKNDENLRRFMKSEKLTKEEQNVKQIFRKFNLGDLFAHLNEDIVDYNDIDREELITGSEEETKMREYSGTEEGEMGEEEEKEATKLAIGEEFDDEYDDGEGMGDDYDYN